MATPQVGRGAVRKLILLLLPPVLSTSGGCLWRGYAGEVENRPYTDRIILSADGRQAAYVWTDRCWSLIPFPPAMPMDTLAEAKTEWLGWCTPDGGNHLVRIDGRTHIGGGFGNSRSIEGIAFSPDGRHLAAMLEDRIEVVDTGTGGMQRIACPQGNFTNVRWFNNTQLAYGTTKATEEEPGDYVERSIYRQAIDKGDPVPVFSRTGRSEQYPGLSESWAPDGRTVLLAEGPELRRLDIASGESSLLLRASLAEQERNPLSPASGPAAQPPILLRRDTFGWGSGWDVDWSPDGEFVSVLARGSFSGNLLLAGLFDCRTWRFTDLTAAFRRDLGEKCVSPICWTPDGLLLVTRSKPGKSETALIRYNPWQVIDFTERYGREFARNDSGFEVVRHLTPGWLAVGPCKEDPTMYAVDYEGKKQLPLTDKPFAASRDGRRLAEVVSKGKIAIRTLTLPAN